MVLKESVDQFVPISPSWGAAVLCPYNRRRRHPALEASIGAQYAPTGRWFYCSPQPWTLRSIEGAFLWQAQQLLRAGNVRRGRFRGERSFGSSGGPPTLAERSHWG